jgi:acetyltransferase-like isoleucine patch superfamily enzyme
VTAPAQVTLGRRVALGRDFYVETDLVVGDDVLFAGRVSVVGNVHPLDGPGPVTGPYVGPPGVVRLDGDNLVGQNAVLIGPCHLERGAVVGAGAIATGSLLADTIYVGVPARPLRRRDRSGGQPPVTTD